MKPMALRKRLSLALDVLYLSIEVSGRQRTRYHKDGPLRPTLPTLMTIVDLLVIN